MTGYRERVLPRQQPKFLARRLIVLTGAVLVLATGFYLPMTLLAPISPVAAQVQVVGNETQAAPSLAWPDFGASAIGAVGFPGTLASSGSTEPRPIASITKIVTSLVILNAKPLGVGDPGPIITFSSKDAALVQEYTARNGETKPVRAGMTLTQLQVNEVMLIASANNYAESYSTWAFGSQEAFLSAARTWLAAHGLNRTTLLDSSGMNPGNTSTASDLVALGKLALANPVIAGIVSIKNVAIPGVGEIKNSNKLLGQAGVDGIKTGTLDEAGACLLFSTQFLVGGHSITLIGVALGGVNHPTLDTAVRGLISTAKKGFHTVTLSTAGQSFASYSMPWNTKVRVVATSHKPIVVWANTPISTRVSVVKVGLAKAGQQVGSVLFTVGEKKVIVPLTLEKSIDDPGIFWRLANPFPLFE
jgi:D-alanyl-D-alanine carboxypeptidase (penicillin-binding protein 5/6)